MNQKSFELNKNLELAKNQLKTEFIGLDETIDKIIDSVKPWYLTPELITRPSIISLWGMTGTGKTSLVTRLIQLLNLENKSSKSDCGELDADESSCFSRGELLFNNICSSINISADDLNNISETDVFDPIIILDEFQYLRIKNELGAEKNKPSLRIVWNLLDTGIISSEFYNYGLNRLLSHIQILSKLSNVFPDLKMSGFKLIDPEDIKIAIEHIGPFLFDNEEDKPYCSNTKDMDKDLTLDIDYKLINSEGESVIPPSLTLLNSDQLKVLMKYVKITKYSNPLKDLKMANTLGTFVSILKDITGSIKKIHYLNCSKSLIFIIGNLDESFGLPEFLHSQSDVDADVLYELTNKVTIIDIKRGLNKRFRPEQVARLGNNLIKYPTFDKKGFKELIKLETRRLLNIFKGNCEHPVDVQLTEPFYELLYAEGVFPLQGARPIFSTIEIILLPFLSRIMLEMDESTRAVTINIKDYNELTKFYKSATTVLIKFDSPDKTIEIDYKLNLGSLRDPNPINTPNVFSNSIHECGHAIVMAYRTGHLPIRLASVGTDRTYNEGFCDDSRCCRTNSIREIDDDIMIGLGGYQAESLLLGIAGRSDMVSIGSKSDIKKSWGIYMNAVLRGGYFTPSPMLSWNMAAVDGNESDPVIPGFDVRNYKVSFNDTECLAEDAIRLKWEQLMKEVHVILFSEIKLLREMALFLGKVGYMERHTMLELIKQHGNYLNEEILKSTRERYSPDIYLKILKGEKE